MNVKATQISSWLFVQTLVQTNKNRNIKTPQYWPFEICEFTEQRANNAESVSMLWCLHGFSNRVMCHLQQPINYMIHDDVIKWKHSPRYWPFVRGIHRSPVNSPHKGQWRGALMFSLTSAWINGWVNNREAGDLRRHHGHYDVTLVNRTSTPRSIFVHCIRQIINECVITVVAARTWI